MPVFAGSETPADRNRMRMTDKGTLYIVSAPSGAGKTSLVAALVEKSQGRGLVCG